VHLGNMTDYDDKGVFDCKYPPSNTNFFKNIAHIQKIMFTFEAYKKSICY